MDGDNKKQHPFKSLFSRTCTREVEPFWILMKQEMMGWQWHWLDHMQMICTSLKTDNHTSTSSLSFYRKEALPDAHPTTS